METYDTTTNANAPKQRQTDELVELAQQQVTLVCDSSRRTYAWIPQKGGGVTLAGLRSRMFRRHLQRSYRAKYGTVPSQHTVSAAVEALDAEAADSEEATLHTRIAGGDGVVRVDLNDQSGRAVEATSEGWKVAASPDTAFRRKPTARALPEPIRGGSLGRLGDFINVSGSDLKLVIAWAVGALLPEGPYPVLILQGEAGTAKSTASKLLKSLIDPGLPLLRPLPRSERDLAIAAEGAHVLAFDNLSGLPTWMSDALCRLSTGGGFATRALFTDDEEWVVEITRPLVLNGIDAIATRQDLITRALVIRLDTIPPEDRVDEAEILAAFEAERPRLLGALMDAVSMAIQQAPSTQLSHRPRMADFASWVTAAEPALGWEPGTFLAAYEANAAYALRLSLDGSPVARAVTELVRSPGGEPSWEGTPTQLLDVITQFRPLEVTKGRAWPANAQSLSRKLTLLAPALRADGIDIVDMHQGRDADKERWVVVTDRHRSGDAGDGGDA
ncbi:MAG TPA: hypothetical protein VHF90_04065 [Thermoleophilaceae bacterium]|nr:hypothetical protein [Thermoleophilaceae bacterium]